jgi:hypothetical protein
VAITLEKANFTITDEDNVLSDLTLKVQSGNNYTYLDNTVIPAENYNGVLTVKVIVSDPNEDSQVFFASITVIPVNDPPMVISNPPLTGYVGNLYGYAFNATDVDDASLTYSAVQKPDWLTFTVANGVLSGTPTQANKGQNMVTLRVSDGKVDVNQDFVITVSGPDGLETFEAAGIRVYPVPAGEYLNLQFEIPVEETQLEVLAVSGSIVKKDAIPANQTGYYIDLSRFEAGTYLIHLRNSKLNIIGRIAVVK